ncbi:hypothetical protein G9A89_002573, partial [Geosiphon pyriformis]
DSVLSPIFGDPNRGVFLRWSNEKVLDSKNRKSTERAKQPDAIISVTNQLSWGSNRRHASGFSYKSRHTSHYLQCILDQIVLCPILLQKWSQKA